MWQHPRTARFAGISFRKVRVSQPSLSRFLSKGEGSLANHSYCGGM
jgi:hypothetical protein